MSPVCLLALLPLLALPARAAAQADRFDVGLRLRAFEVAWDEQKDEENRKLALKEIANITQLFFANQLAEVGKALDRGRQALRWGKEADADVRWAEALSVRPEVRLLDTGATELAVTVAPFYKLKVDAVKGANLVLLLSGPNGKVVTSKSYRLGALPMRAVLPLKEGKIPEGDLTLEANVSHQGDTGLANLPPQTVSFVANLDGRLRALAKAAQALPKEAGTDGESVRGLLGILESLALKKVLETHYPAARLLTEAEQAVKTIAAGKPFHGKDRPGEYWLKLAAGKEPTAVRVLVPDAAKQGKPLPLVIALHGAGGSENLFFDGYGRGAVVRLCRERGWLLVAPRTTGFSFTGSFDALMDEVARLYPVDRKRVFVVGHSMGAAQAVSAAQAAPERYAAVAALGGGGFVQKSDKLKAVPFFVGVGTKDFAVGMARTLKKGLEQAGVTTVQFREYPEIEHLVIVQAALPDVFAFFDKCSAPKKE